MNDRPYYADPARLHLKETGYKVRAILKGKPSAFDIAHLCRESLMRWLQSSEDTAIKVVLSLLAHPQLPPRDQLPTVQFNPENRRPSPGMIPRISPPPPPPSRRSPPPAPPSKRMFPPSPPSSKRNLPPPLPKRKIKK